MYFTSFFQEFVDQYELIRIVSQAEVQQTLSQLICLESPKAMQLCMQMFNQFYGPSTQIGVVRSYIP